MKIVNKTHWRSDHLRAILTRVARDELDPAKRRTIVVTVIPARRYTSGYAWVGGDYLTLRVPSQIADKASFAKVAAHEMAHCRGNRHDLTRNADRYDWTTGWRERYKWAEDMPLEKQPPAVIHKEALLSRDIRYTEAMLKRAQTRLKRTATSIKKWENRLKRQRLALEKVAADRPNPYDDPANAPTDPEDPEYGAYGPIVFEPFPKEDA